MVGMMAAGMVGVVRVLVVRVRVLVVFGAGVVQ